MNREDSFGRNVTPINPSRSLSCRPCFGEGVRYIEEDIGDGVYTTVDAIDCRSCGGTGKVKGS